MCRGDWEVGVDCVFIYGNYGNKKFEIEIFYIFLLLNLYINNIILILKGYFFCYILNILYDMFFL